MKYLPYICTELRKLLCLNCRIERSERFALSRIDDTGIIDLFGFLVFTQSAQHCLLDSAEDILITGASAEMTGEKLAQLILSVLFTCV